MGVVKGLFSGPCITTRIGVVTSMLLIRIGVLGAGSPLEPGAWPPGKGEASPGPVVF